MNLHTLTAAKIIRLATIVTLLFMAGYGLSLVLAEIKPFWNDEWRLIYNLKFKTAEELWGPLIYTQQFPRVYIQCFKAFTSLLNYSYFGLRFPSYLVGIAIILFSWRLMNKIYKADSPTRYLFVLILISSLTFTQYFVQVKHYTMEIFLSAVAIWQLMELIRIPGADSLPKFRYTALCASFLVCPFFSYTYPIAIAPVFAVVLLQGVPIVKARTNRTEKKKALILQWMPLLLCAFSILVFYRIDVSRLMTDKEMLGYWNYRMMSGGHSIQHYAGKLWDFFAQVGSGLLFEIIFGMLGICAFLFGAYKWAKNRNAPSYSKDELLRLYSLLLILLSLALFFAGKLPIEPKFNAYTVPAISILIIYMADTLCSKPAYHKSAFAMIIVLSVQLMGNIFSTSFSLFTAPEYARRMRIYAATEKAIALAQSRNLPMLITPGVAYPDAITLPNPYMSPITAASVLKTFPAYDGSGNLPVYSIPDSATMLQKMALVPVSVKTLLAGDGETYKEISRKE